MKWSATRSKDARKYSYRKFPTRAIMLWNEIFAWHKNFLSRLRGSIEEECHDNASSDRAQLSNLRKQLPVAGGGDNQRLWGEEDGFP